MFKTRGNRLAWLLKIFLPGCLIFLLSKRQGANDREGGRRADRERERKREILINYCAGLYFKIYLVLRKSIIYSKSSQAGSNFIQKLAASCT